MKNRNTRRISLLLMLLTISLSTLLAQTPDITTKDVTFESKGITLAGTIYIPQKYHAGVVLVHGSDQTPRMREFAFLLAKNEIAVLTYDKRGVGESGGIYVGPEVGTNNIDPTNLNLLAEDASGAIEQLSKQIENTPIGLVGFSQAGWIIPLAANKNPRVEFTILFSGSVIPTLEQLRFQFYTNGDTNFWNTHTETEVRKHIDTAKDRYQFENTDPVEMLNTLTIPGLWLFGQKDIQVPVALSIERLNMLKAKGKPYEYCLFPDLDHFVSNSTQPIEIAIQWIKKLRR